MAKNSNERTAAPTFYEVVMKGSPKAVRGLLAGFALGQDLECCGWYHQDYDIAPGGDSASVRRAVERLHLLPVSEVRVVVDGNLAKLLRARAKRIAGSGVAEVESVKRIKQARVEVRYHTYARRYDEEVQILLRDLPRGVKLMDVEREVETDEEARGVEAYTAVHHFESQGSATLLGRFDLVLDLRDRLDVHPLIECDDIELVLA
jgi:hypothetical protein